MRAIYVAQMDKIRPVLLLTRDWVVPHLSTVTVALVTTRIRGLPTEVHVGRANGLDHDCVVNCDLLGTLDPADLRDPPVGYLFSHQEPELTAALHAAFDLG